MGRSLRSSARPRSSDQPAVFSQRSRNLRMRQISAGINSITKVARTLDKTSLFIMKNVAIENTFTRKATTQEIMHKKQMIYLVVAIVVGN